MRPPIGVNRGPSWKIYQGRRHHLGNFQCRPHPSTGADMPEYEPRGCSRGAFVATNTADPHHALTRRPPRHVPRCQEAPHDPVDAWAAVVETRGTRLPQRSLRRIQQSWEEAMEIVASAYVHTIKQYGPTICIAGFLGHPAMSMISLRRGARFHALSAPDLRPSTTVRGPALGPPSVFGDQTDVPIAENGQFSTSSWERTCR